jgi:uncharacterized protein (TIGR00369 family)
MKRPPGLPDDSALVVAYERTFDRVIGLEWEPVVAGEVRASFVVGDHLRSPLGVVQGGVFAAAAEAVASFGAALEAAEGTMAVGLSNDTTVMRQVRDGQVRVQGQARRGEVPDRTVWQVDAFDDDGELCATSAVIMATVERRSS